jgi:5-hydroxyisourate hydrolase
MSTISTHILDTSRGRPASGVGVALEVLKTDAGWSRFAEAETDADGRITQFGISESQLIPGTYRLIFAVAKYFKSIQQESFYPEVVVTFLIAAASEHYHVPLLISPFGYSTYRGS